MQLLSKAHNGLNVYPARVSFQISACFLLVIEHFIRTLRFHLCKLKAIFASLLLTGSLGLISQSASCVFCVIGSLQTFHSSFIHHTSLRLFLAFTHLSPSPVSLTLPLHLCILFTLSPPPHLPSPTSSRPSSIFLSIILSHK